LDPKALIIGISLRTSQENVKTVLGGFEVT
jgi:hypothetical protein